MPRCSRRRRRRRWCIGRSAILALRWTLPRAAWPRCSRSRRCRRPCVGLARILGRSLARVGRAGRRGRGRCRRTGVRRTGILALGLPFTWAAATRGSGHRHGGRAGFSRASVLALGFPPGRIARPRRGGRRGGRRSRVGGAGVVPLGLALARVRRPARVRRCGWNWSRSRALRRSDPPRLGRMTMTRPISSAHQRSRSHGGAGDGRRVESGTAPEGVRAALVGGQDRGDRLVRSVAETTGREEPTAFHPLHAHDRQRPPPPPLLLPGIPRGQHFANRPSAPAVSTQAHLRLLFWRMLPEFNEGMSERRRRIESGGIQPGNPRQPRDPLRSKVTTHRLYGCKIEANPAAIRRATCRPTHGRKGHSDPPRKLLAGSTLKDADPAARSPPSALRRASATDVSGQSPGCRTACRDQRGRLRASPRAQFAF